MFLRVCDADVNGEAVLDRLLEDGLSAADEPDAELGRRIAGVRAGCVLLV